MQISTIQIEVPDLNDSFSRISLLGRVYYLRFTWSDTASRWLFGLFDDKREPIYQGVKLVPNYPVNLITGTDNGPDGIFYAKCDAEAIGRSDFLTGKATFHFSYGER